MHRCLIRKMHIENVSCFRVSYWYRAHTWTKYLRKTQVRVMKNFFLCTEIFAFPSINSTMYPNTVSNDSRFETTILHHRLPWKLYIYIYIYIQHASAHVNTHHRYTNINKRPATFPFSSWWKLNMNSEFIYRDFPYAFPYTYIFYYIRSDIQYMYMCVFVEVFPMTIASAAWFNVWIW